MPGWVGGWVGRWVDLEVGLRDGLVQANKACTVSYSMVQFTSFFMQWHQVTFILVMTETLDQVHYLLNIC